MTHNDMATEPIYQDDDGYESPVLTPVVIDVLIHNGAGAVADPATYICLGES